MKPKAIRWMLSVWVLGLCLGLVVSMPVHAQVSGATLSGTITDPQGGAVPNAKVTARNVATGVSSDTETNGSGLYTLPNLNAGDYEISVTAQGFSTAVAKLTLTVGQKQELNLPLAVGQVEQSVQVTTEAPQVELESSTISSEVSANTVRELPLNGRDWASLATLQPAVVPVRTQLDPTHVGTSGRGLGSQLSVSGARPTQNSYRLDGAVVNDYSNAGPGSVLGGNLGVDSIQEFSVLTSAYSAEYGFTSGGVINAITKSGTNSFHGTGFDFIRNDIMDARNFFTKAPVLLPKNNLQQNQFGASAGYRILKDKLFLFGNYEGVRQYKGVPESGGVIPSTNARNGIIANESVIGGVASPTNASGTPTCQIALTCDTFVVPVDANVAKYLALWPTPTVVGGVDQNRIDQNTDAFSFLGQSAAIENFVTGRGDYKLSDKDSLFATYVRDYSTFTIPGGTINTVNLFEDSYRQAIIAEETHVFSATWVNTFRAAEDRTSTNGGNTPVANAVNPATKDASLSYLPATNFAPGVALTSTGVTTPQSALGGASVQDFWGQILQVYDDAFHQTGNHGLKFGGSFFAYQENGYTPLAGFNGSATFTFAGVTNAANTFTIPTFAEGNNNSGAAPTGAGVAQFKCFIPGSAKAANGGVGNNSNNYDKSCGSFANFATNEPNAAGRPFDPSEAQKHYLRSKIMGLYLQDDYKVRRTLTLNLGIRYEPSTIPTEIHNLIDVMPTPYTVVPCGAANPGVNPSGGNNPAFLCPQQSVLIAQAYGNTSQGQAGAPIMIGNSVSGAYPTTVMNNKYFVRNPTLANIEPRLGFAWDVFGNGKTALRGGFGVFDSLPLPYELILDNTSQQGGPSAQQPFRPTWGSLGNQFNSPSSIAGCAPQQLAIVNSANLCNTTIPAGTTLTPANNVWPTNVMPVITAGGAITPTGTWNYIDNNIKRTYVYQFNLSLSRQLTSDTTLSIAYAGSRGYHEPFKADSVNTSLPVNIGHPIPGIGYYWPGCLPNELGNGTAAGGPVLQGQNFPSTPAGPLAITTGNCNTAGTANNIVYEWAGASNLTAQEKTARELNPSTGSMFTTQYQTQSWYDSLQINLVKRMAHGFQAQLAFTYSKSLDDTSGSAAGDTFQLSVVTNPWWDLALDKGPSEFNVGRNLVFNGTWDVPTPKNWGSAFTHIAGGWELGAIVTAGTGVPEQPIMGQDILGEVTTTLNPPFLMPGCTPNTVIDPNYRHDLTYFKTGAASCLGITPQTAANTPFCDTTDQGRAATGVFVPGNNLCPNIRGNLGRDAIAGPGLFQMNASLFKNNYIPKISEAFNIQFRAEFFNLTNHTNFGASGNSSFLSSTNGTQNNSAPLSAGSNFMQLTKTQGDNRIIQLALKVIW